MTTAIEKKLLPFPALLRHHIGKLCALGLFLTILSIGQLDALTGLLLKSESSWSASTLSAVPKSKPTKSSGSKLEMIATGVQQSWQLFKSMMDLALGDSRTQNDHAFERQPLEKTLQEAIENDPAFKLKDPEMEQDIKQAEERIHQYLKVHAREINAAQGR